MTSPASQQTLTNDNTEYISYINAPEIVTQRYSFEKRLGKGSQGEVWLANRKADGEKVAIKRLNIHSATTWKQYELFKREAEILSSLDIQGVAPFLEYIEDLSAEPPYVCIVQKFIDGKTLGEWIEEKHRFEAHVVYDIILQVLNILQQLHTHKPPVIHRDIKPSNLMLTPSEDGKFQVTLLDFGAVANPQVQNGGSTVAGTFGYMPPEQLMGQAQPASDIYALAAVAVQMLTGIAPADIETCDFKLVIEPHLTHIPKEVVNTLSWMLEPALENRIADHHALIAQFSNLIENKPASLMKFVFKTGTPKLENVEHICQPGNYNIWQDFDAQKASQIDFHAIDKRFIHQNKPVHNNLNRKIILYCFLLLLFFSLFIFLIPHIQSILSMAAFVQLGMIALMGWGLKSLYQTAKLNHALKKLSSNIKKLDAKVHANKWLNVQNLLRNGQKFVGKITHIYYVSSASQTVSTLKSARQCILTPDEIPKFYITYVFKLPFRDRIYEFHADMATYHAPEHRYKVGDLITLIASISSTENSTDELSYLLEVMPYPYPFEDVRSESDILFKQVFTENILNQKSQEDASTEAMRMANHHLTQNDEWNALYRGMAICLGKTDLLLFQPPTSAMDNQANRGTQYTEIDCEYAFHIERAFGKGCAEAGQHLAIAYQEIYQYFLAEVWFYNAFTAGFITAYEQCAKMFINFNSDKVEEWYQIAFNAGIKEAALTYAEMYQAMNKFDKAEKWYQTAFKTDITDAALTCANMYKKEYEFSKAEEWYEKAFDAGITEAALKCAEMYEAEPEYANVNTTDKMVIGESRKSSLPSNYYNTLVSPKQIGLAKAEIWYQIAFDAGITEVALTCAKRYKKEHNFSKAEEWYEKAFDAGIKEAIITCAEMYQNNRKFQKAENCYKLAFENGNKEAIITCAEMYQNNRKFQKAENCYKLAFKNGNKEAIITCAEMYQNENNFQKAENCYKLAFENGNKEAIITCAEMYQNNRKFQKAENCYKLAFENGNKEAIITCAKMYQNEYNLQKAENCYKLAFENGNKEAIITCAEMYKNEQYFSKAENCYKLAFENGNKEAIITCAEMYKNENNFQKAVNYYKLAFENGNKEAIITCAEMYKDKGYLSEAEDCYKLAFESGNKEAVVPCFYMFLKDHQFQKAREWIDRTLSAGYDTKKLEQELSDAIATNELYQNSQHKSNSLVPGIQALYSKNYEDAFKYYCQISPKADAARHIGDFCRKKANQTTQDIQTVLYWYKEAYNYGALDLAETIMFIYYHQLRDKKSALAWFKKSQLYTNQTQLSDDEILKIISNTYQ